MIHEDAIKLLKDKGFDFGWSLTGGILTLWEHEENPPAPLTRPEA